MMDLVDKMVSPTHYSLRHYSSWDMEALRNWFYVRAPDQLHAASIAASVHTREHSERLI